MEPESPPTPPDLPTSPMHPAVEPTCRFRPWLFFPFLLAPGALSLATLLATNGRDYGTQSLLVLMVGSVIAGFVCGIHFTKIQTRLSPGARWGIGIVSVLGCAGVAFALGIGGCFLTASVVGGF